MSKKKILAILVILFLCFATLVLSIGVGLLFRQNQINQTEIENQKKQIEDLKQQRESDAKGSDTGSSSSDPVPPTDDDSSVGGGGSDGSFINTEIHFSRIPQSYDSDFTFTVHVPRPVNRTEPVTLAMEQILAGPTAAETALGYRNPIVLTGASNCGGNLFTFSSNFDSMEDANDVIIQFCKDVTITGVADSARIQSVIGKTMEDLEDSVDYRVNKLAILDKNGNCLGDESGMNACLL